MSRRASNHGRWRSKSKPVRTLLDIDNCISQPSALRGYVDCLVDDPARCPHALSHSDGALCLHPQRQAIPAPTPGRSGRQLSRLALRPHKELANLTFRQASTNDCRLLGRLNYQLIHDLGLPHHMTASEMDKRMRKLLASDHRAILFELGGKVVAYALYRESSKDIYLRQFLVIRARRRQGIARRAVGLLRSQVWSKTKGLAVEVLVANQRALRFWRKVGYSDHSLRLEIPPLRQGNAKGPADRQSL